MMAPLYGAHAPVLAAAARGALVLTVNNRLSRHLHSLYDNWLQQQGREVWPTPQIFSLDGWLRRCLAILGEEGRLLGDFSAQRLWEEAIAADTANEAPGLLQTAATARRALQAHRLLHEYRTDIAGHPLTEDHCSFLRWRERFEERVRVGSWFDACELPDRVAAALRRGQLRPAATVLFVGFDEFSPQLHDLAAAVIAAGGKVEAVGAPEGPCGSAVRLGAADVAAEIRQAARWVRQLLESGRERIGIVVPALAEYRSDIERIFSEEIDPQALPSFSEEETRFSLSLGAPLARQGLVTAALDLLSLQPRSPLESVGFLLRSPYLGGGMSECFGRSALERELREGGSPDVSLSRLQRLAAEKGRKRGDLPRFAMICRTVTQNLADGARRLPGDWATQFSLLLEQAGWPGERPLSSFEYQAYKAWREKLIPALAALDAVCSPVHRAGALSLLRRLAQETIFQPETPEGPVQVVGLLESAGLQFDHLWVMGLTDDVFPAPCRPNPFLPVLLQTAAEMPHASAARELDFARRVLRRLLAAAPEVILSHPCRRGDVDLAPSPLIVALPSGEPVLAPTNAPTSLVRDLGPPLEAVSDGQGPPLLPGEAAVGGTSVFKDQAHCPFRAFVRHRLHARALERPDVGLDAGLRGTLLHAALEEFWQKTQTLDNLVCLDEEALMERINASVATAVERFFSSGRQDSGEALLTLERQRLSRLLRDWLEKIEKHRPSFALWRPEASRRETIGGLTVDIRVDRIDELSDGRRVILDYKTGRIDAGDLFAERLLEPQLPLYGIGEDEEALAALVFARVRLGECALKGVAASAGLLPGVAAVADCAADIAPDLPQLLRRWRRQLEELAAEFIGGEAAVAPADLKKSCSYCDLASLCRIDEIARRAEEDTA